VAFSVPALPVEWAVAGRPLAGETESGDLHLVEPFPGGVLVGVIDGLGHGPQAARAARDARALIAARPFDPLEVVLQRCHAELRGARGVVVSLAALSVNPSMLRFAGIGNVDGVLLRAVGREVTRQVLTSRGGIVGADMRSPRVESLPLLTGDLLLLATDGIRQGFASGIDASAGVAEIAAQICQDHARQTDDALVLALRWLPSAGDG